ncbi:MAG: hypothetical protein DMENIID0003_06800 [Wolbachia endosymbiont of Sergentomyia squamirostris]|uniref:Ankyrin repeat domain protein n=1 Tax=Wolbachia endosymbiont of Sergentomyia squamirostris TaxID=3113640 RepID=A0AAT9GCT7_9RICK
MTLLHLAAEGDYVDVVKLLIEKEEINSNVVDLSGDTPLHYAAGRGHSEIASTLIANGADIHAVDSREQTPLHLAASKSCLEVVNAITANRKCKSLFF